MPRILMIEDDVRLAAMVQDYLRQSGFDVAHSATGAAGVESQRTASCGCRLARSHAARWRRAGRVPRNPRRLPGEAGQAPGHHADRQGRSDRPGGRVLKSAPTITSQSLSSRANCWRASVSCCAAHRGSAGRRQRRGRIRFGRLEVDADARIARLDGDELMLTSHQFALLLAMARAAGQGAFARAIDGIRKGRAARPTIRPSTARSTCTSRAFARHRRRSEGAQAYHHRARRRICLRQVAGLMSHRLWRAMKRLYLRIYLAVLAP